MSNPQPQPQLTSAELAVAECLAATEPDDWTDDDIRTAHHLVSYLSGQGSRPDQ